MFINIGRVLMLLVWTVMIYNIFMPFAKPLNYILNVAFSFMVIMHILKLLILKIALANEQTYFSKAAQIRLFFFGVFELLAWQKELQGDNKKVYKKG